MLLFFCPKCGTIIGNSHICGFGCGETIKVNNFDINGLQEYIAEYMNYRVHIEKKDGE